DRVAIMHLGKIERVGTPEELKDEVGPVATMEDVFRHFTGYGVDESGEARGGLREIRGARRTARRVG
ncbi:MAG TPA: hypothetical protein VGL76_10265, partial [Gaiellaceae bacterium]